MWVRSIKPKRERDQKKPQARKKERRESGEIGWRTLRADLKRTKWA
jgi:hypothetical protein